MPIKFKSNCRVCQEIKDDRGLQKRLYACRYYVVGGESMSSIARDKGWNLIGLSNHLKKHQAITADDLQGKTLQIIHRHIVDQRVQAILSTSDIRKRLIDELSNTLDSEEFKQLAVDKKVTLLLRATKDADDVAAKRTDQNVDVMKMMAGARSGAITEKPREVIDVTPAEDTEDQLDA